MNLVLQRINSCVLSVDNVEKANVGFGLLILTGVHKNDTFETADFLAKKISKLRIFKDENNKINKSILDVNGSALVVSNFTLLANTQTGNRPDFSQSGDPAHAKEIYEFFISKLKEYGIKEVQKGCFGEHMHLNANLDGPYTITISK